MGLSPPLNSPLHRIYRMRMLSVWIDEELVWHISNELVSCIISITENNSKIINGTFYQLCLIMKNSRESILISLYRLEASTTSQLPIDIIFKYYKVSEPFINSQTVAIFFSRLVFDFSYSQKSVIRINKLLIVVKRREKNLFLYL